MSANIEPFFHKCSPLFTIFLLCCFVQGDYSSGEEFARKCVWYIPTRDEGAKLLKKLPKKELFSSTGVVDGDIPRRPLSETLPSQETSQHKLDSSNSAKCQEKHEMDKFDNWNDYVKLRISKLE